MSLRLDLAALRDEARALRSLLERLESRIEELEGLAAFEVVSESPARSSGAHQPSNPGTPCRASGPPAGRSTTAGSALPSAGEFGDGSGPEQPGPPTSEFRVQVAQAVGRFLAGQLAGNRTGGSGRDRLRLASKFYIVCRDSSGKDYLPPLVTSSFSRVKQLCFVGGNRDNCGSSVFIGLPSQSEVRLALAAAGLPCPTLSGNGGQ